MYKYNPCGQRAEKEARTPRAGHEAEAGAVLQQQRFTSPHLGPQSSRCMTLAVLPWPWR